MIELPFPHKALWPNGRAHFREKARRVKEHRAWAGIATRAARSLIPADVRRISWIVHPKPRGPAPDRDNAAAAAKSYQDGICDALGINDRDLAEPRIIIGERVPHGRFVAVLSGEVE